MIVIALYALFVICLLTMITIVGCDIYVSHRRRTKHVMKCQKNELLQPIDRQLCALYNGDIKCHVLANYSEKHNDAKWVERVTHRMDADLLFDYILNLTASRENYELS